MGAFCLGIVTAAAEPKSHIVDSLTGVSPMPDKFHCGNLSRYR